jgi:protein farnesyltransferase/geranylgeranyltransferase type-1 subunit alpha
MTRMFGMDSKNYHVWSYRQYLVRKLNLFPTAYPSELEATTTLIGEDVRNNSAWSHRFFLVFCDPAISTPGIASTARDEKVPRDVIDREIEFAKAKIWKAPQNLSPWNYIKGVLRKGGVEYKDLEAFAADFVKVGADGQGIDVVKSSHALEFLVDIWARDGKAELARTGLGLLATKYDPVRSGYWAWRGKALGIEVPVKTTE